MDQTTRSYKIKLNGFNSGRPSVETKDFVRKIDTFVSLYIIYLLPTTWSGRDKFGPELLAKLCLEGGDFGGSVSRDFSLIERVGESFVLIAGLHRKSVVESGVFLAVNW